MTVAPFAFSTGELTSRRRRLLDAAAAAGADTVVGYGRHRSGSAVGWLTGWPVTREAVAVLTTGRPVRLLVDFPNHVPDARRTVQAAGLGDRVEPLDGAAPAATVASLAHTGGPRPIGVVGPMPSALRDAIGSWATRVVGLDDEYTRLRVTKSAEELGLLRHAARLTDAAASALLDAAAAGASEHEMVAAAEYSYRRSGGTHHICYLCTTTMAAPDRCVPAQWPSDRRAGSGDVVVFELSAAAGPDYPAQLLRTATVGAPTALYAQLHDVADAVRDDLVRRIRPGVSPRDLLDALELVHADGLTTVDDLVHGLGGGYLPPVLSGRTDRLTGLHDEPLRAGMTLVVQPNVCTGDLSAGVQTGEMVVVTEHGCESLHTFPAGLVRLDGRRARLSG